MSDTTSESLIGQLLTLTIGAPANGGTCVARADDGRVVFVRDALPGEVVTARVTGEGKKGRFLEAEVAEVLTPNSQRVTPPCRYSRECGGCDLQHAALPLQREMKAQIVVDLIQRLGGVTEIGGVPVAQAITCEQIGGDEPADSGLGTRTRVRYAVDEEGRLAMRRRGSHGLVQVDSCPLGTPALSSIASEFRDGDPGLDVEFIESDDGMVVVRTAADDYAQVVHREVAELSWQIAASGFWQVHRNAAEALVEKVSRLLGVRPGNRVLDLYAGAGLFTGALARLVGSRGSVDAVESNGQSVADGENALGHLGNVTFQHAQVQTWLKKHPKARPDLVVCDPPRAGLGAVVVQGVCALRPEAIAYVSCDPATLARDIATARDSGYTLTALEVLDMFPMTAHIECVALLTPTRVAY
jgi:tRNA/tmRNA/rRNA uracil-C5-methylase (TrmA/RlmC/RlmD family)